MFFPSSKPVFLAPSSVMIVCRLCSVPIASISWTRFPVMSYNATGPVWWLSSLGRAICVGLSMQSRSMCLLLTVACTQPHGVRGRVSRISVILYYLVGYERLPGCCVAVFPWGSRLGVISFATRHLSPLGYCYG